MTSIIPTDEQHWHALRFQNIGASESAALFGESPWLTRWQLWHQKKGNLDGYEDNDSMMAGRYFEPAIAEYAKAKWGIQLQKVHRYITSDETPGMGASLDYQMVGTGSHIPTEIKYSIYGDGWEYEGDEITEAPLYYLIQVQHQLACMPSAPYGQLIGFLRNGIKRMVIERRPTIIDAIRKEIDGFWSSIRDDKEPEIDYLKDAAAVSKLSLNVNFVDLDLSEDAAMRSLCAGYLESAANARAALEAKEKCKTEALVRIMELARAQGATEESQKVVVSLGEFRISASRVSENLGTVITEEMIGQSYGGRKGFRGFRVSKPKGKSSRKSDKAEVADAAPAVDLNKTKPVF